MTKDHQAIIERTLLPSYQGNYQFRHPAQLAGQGITHVFFIAMARQPIRRGQKFIHFTLAVPILMN